MTLNDNPNADFSDVGGSSSASPGNTGGAADFSDVRSGGSTTATVSVDTTPIRVSDIQVGKSVGTDNKVTNQTTTFAVRDTMYVAVITDGAAKDAKISTKWMYNGTKVVDSSSQTISPTGGTNATEFHINKKTAWPKGKYTVEVVLNGVSAGKKDDEVT